MITFSNPILLGGLAAVALPILIHLLHRQRFKRVVWAAMRFLQVSLQRNQRRMRLEDLLLVVLRCVLVALLALALARPSLRSETSGLFGPSKVTGVILLDHSRSMGVSDGVRTRFDLAKQAAEQVLDALPAGSAVALWWVSDTVQPAIPEPTLDLNLVRKLVREAPWTDRSTDLWPGLQRAVHTLQRRLSPAKAIYLITDGQAQAWRHWPQMQQLLETARQQVATHIILVGEPELANVGISNLQLAGGLCPVRQPVRFEVQVTNYGRNEARHIPVRLSVDQELPCDEFTIEALPGGASQSVALFARLSSSGFHAVTARIPSDRLPADDVRTLAVRAIQDVRVLLVDGDPGSEPRSSETFFLRHALVPVPPDRASDYFIRPTVVTVPELAQVRFDDFDAVILANVAELPETELAALAAYVRRGGGLMVFLGDRINATFYNEVLGKRLGLLPAALGDPRGQANQQDQFFTLQAQGYEHPIVTLWNDPAAGTLSSARFYRAFELKELDPTGPAPRPTPTAATDGQTQPEPLQASRGNEAGAPRVVLRFADGTLAMAERAWGQGRVILFASTADTAWTDLPVRPAFVPLLHRALGALVQHQDQALNPPVGGSFAWHLPPDYLDRDALVSKPGQPNAVRDLRRIEMLQGRPTVRYDQIHWAGLYEVSVPDPPLTLRFAAQADPAESNLEGLSPAQLEQLGRHVTVTTWRPGAALHSAATPAGTHLDLWLPLALVALAVAVVEMCLAQWFSRPK